MLSKTDNHNYVHVGNISDIEAVGGCLTVTVEKHPIAIFIYDSKVYAVDNRCPHNSHLPVILAGGLTQDNVQNAMRSVGPYAVDVNSGVKISRTSRRKDPVKVREFIYRAKNALFSSTNDQ